jgi:hypothetical protein
MNYILNTDELLYVSMDELVSSPFTPDTEDNYFLLFVYPIEALFEKIKRRSALRGKLAKDQQGMSRTEEFQLTEDERDAFMDFLRSGASEIFKQVSGFSKTINSAFRFNVNFGVPEFSSIISEVDGTGLIITDGGLPEPMTTNQYAGMKLVIVSPGLYENEERTIISNDDYSFTIDEVLPEDVEELEYIIAAQTEKHITIYSLLDVANFDTNMLLGIDSLFEKCFIGSVLKEWYLINRFMDDYKVEETLLKDAISDLRMHYFQALDGYRASQFMADPDSEV